VARRVARAVRRTVRSRRSIGALWSARNHAASGSSRYS
jgi:hypothetical protein